METTRNSQTGRLEAKSGGPDKDQITLPQASRDKNQRSGIHLSTLQNLKAIFLSMDWEMNDQTLTKLIDESERLMKRSEDDMVLTAYLKMLSSLGKYIKTSKADSDKDAVRLLRSVYEGMEKVISAEEMPDAERKRLVTDKINKFQILKQKIEAVKTGDSAEEGIDSSPGDTEIRNIKGDVTALRREVNELRNQVGALLKALDRQTGKTC